MSYATPVNPRIQKTRTPAFPQFFFEWHEETQKAYVVEIPGAWVDGEFAADLTRVTADGTCIAEHVQTHGQFLGFVQTYLRGYRKGAADTKAAR
jgi:hypothetical protein